MLYKSCLVCTWSSLLHKADSRLAPSQWETSLQSNAVSHWLGANLGSALLHMILCCRLGAKELPKRTPFKTNVTTTSLYMVMTDNAHNNFTFTKRISFLRANLFLVAPWFLSDLCNHWWGNGLSPVRCQAITPSTTRFLYLSTEGKSTFGCNLMKYANSFKLIFLELIN